MAEGTHRMTVSYHCLWEATEGCGDLLSFPYAAQNGQKGPEELERAREPIPLDQSVSLTISSPRPSLSAQTVKNYRSGEGGVSLSSAKENPH